jgi:hypothetical protein
MARRDDPMRPHVLEIPLVWATINVVAFSVAIALAEGLTQPETRSGARTAILVACLVGAGAVLYGIRRRFVPH